MMNAQLPAWLLPIIDTLQQRLPPDFVGQIEVNCFLGSISNVNVRQSYKSPQKELCLTNDVSAEQPRRAAHQTGNGR